MKYDYFKGNIHENVFITQHVGNANNILYMIYQHLSPFKIVMWSMEIYLN